MKNKQIIAEIGQLTLHLGKKEDYNLLEKALEKARDKNNLTMKEKIAKVLNNQSDEDVEYEKGWKAGNQVANEAVLALKCPNCDNPMKHMIEERIGKKWNKWHCPNCKQSYGLCADSAWINVHTGYQKGKDAFAEIDKLRKELNESLADRIKQESVMDSYDIEVEKLKQQLAEKEKELKHVNEEYTDFINRREKLLEEANAKIKKFEDGVRKLKERLNDVLFKLFETDKKTDNLIDEIFLPSSEADNGEQSLKCKLKNL